MNATPFNMPKKAPKRVWTPPASVTPKASEPMPVTIPKADNAKARRLKRNGWDDRAVEAEGTLEERTGLTPQFDGTMTGGYYDE